MNDYARTGMLTTFPYYTSTPLVNQNTNFHNLSHLRISRYYENPEGFHGSRDILILSHTQKLSAHNNH